MSLNWYATKVKNWDAVLERMRDENDPSIFERDIYEVSHLTMLTGINHITKKNIKDWCYRVKFMRAIGRCETGARKNEDGEWYYDLEDPEFMKNFIGFRTNASSQTIKQFANTCFDRYCLENKI